LYCDSRHWLEDRAIAQATATVSVIGLITEKKYCYGVDLQQYNVIFIPYLAARIKRMDGQKNFSKISFIGFLAGHERQSIFVAVLPLVLLVALAAATLSLPDTWQTVVNTTAIALVLFGIWRLHLYWRGRIQSLQQKLDQLNATENAAERRELTEKELRALRHLLRRAAAEDDGKWHRNRDDRPALF
jgi:low affinity Fe/Cu permease